MKAISLHDAFWARVHRAGMDDCWLWQGNTDRDGYGIVKSGGRMHRASRACWRLHYGEIPEGAMVLHRCDVPGCVNPAHLFLGDARVNIYDAMAKGRRAEGENHANAWLSDDEARQVRVLYAEGWRPVDIQAAFGIPRTTLHRIARGADRFAKS